MGANDYYSWSWKADRIADGVNGGSYAPTTPWVLGGSGVSLASPGNQIRGGLRTRSGGRLILGQNDVPATSPPRARVITMSLLPTTPYSLGPAQFYASQGGHQFQFDPSVSWPRVAPPSGSGFAPGYSVLYIPIPPEYLQNVGFGTFDGVLSSVTLNYTVLAAPTRLPPQSNTFAAPFMSVISQAGPNPGVSGRPLGAQQIYNNGQLPYWPASTAVSAGTYCLPVDFLHGSVLFGAYFKVTTAGVTGSGAPAWNTAPGSTTADGSAVWTCIGGTGAPLLPGQFPFLPGIGEDLSINDWYNNGAPQSLSVGFDPGSIHSGLSLVNNIFAVALNLPVDASKTAPYNVVPMVLHSLKFAFVNYTTMSWR